MPVGLIQITEGGRLGIVAKSTEGLGCVIMVTRKTIPGRKIIQSSGSNEIHLDQSGRLFFLRKNMCFSIKGKDSSKQLVQKPIVLSIEKRILLLTWRITSS